MNTKSRGFDLNMAINENDSRVRRTKKLIRQGLTELAQEKSIDKITVKELTDKIDINRGTFYLHYSDIENLVDCIRKDIYEGFRRILDDVTLERILKEPGEILFDICSFLKQNSDICSLLLSSYETSALARDIGALLDEKCRELLMQAYPNLNKEAYVFLSEYFIYGGVGLVRSWFKLYPDKTPRQISELLLKLTKSGIIEISKSEAKENLQK